mmetsp:Transcript_47757/g.79098  ORF Transcript_47757/g.79098 Transcript_47757/m.79098 type:complete len:94 (+) Transcript_47757:1092-1373(+)
MMRGTNCSILMGSSRRGLLGLPASEQRMEIRICPRLALLNMTYEIPEPTLIRNGITARSLLALQKLQKQKTIPPPVHTNAEIQSCLLVSRKKP